MAHWIQEARESMERRGTVGKFSRDAKRHGMSTQAFARKEKHAGGKIGKEANFAINASKARH